MTLVELIIAMLLVSTFLLAGVSVELAMRRIHRTADLEAVLSAEGEMIMLKVSSDLQASLGALHPIVASESPFTVGGNPYYKIRRDSNFNARPDSSDQWSGYHFFAPAYELRYFPDASHGNYEVFSDHVQSFSLVRHTNNACVRIDLSLVYTPWQPSPTISNPRVDFTACVQPRAASIS